jgi:hypothetical protein
MPPPIRKLGLEALEALIAPNTLTGLDSSFIDTYHAGQPSVPMGVAYADYSLCNDSAGGGASRSLTRAAATSRPPR